MPRKKVEEREDGQLLPFVQSDDRSYRAAMARARGMDWAEIAELEEYNSPADARLSVTAYIQRAAMVIDEAQRVEALNMTMLRLDVLLQKAWAQVDQGDLKAIDTCLRIIMQQAKLWGFEDRTERVTNNTVIVRPEDFAKTFQSHVEGRSA